jgi:hypothetical protein
MIKLSLTGLFSALLLSLCNVNSIILVVAAEPGTPI